MSTATTIGLQNQRMGTPPAEVSIDERLARDLLRSQHPDLADLPIVALASGWDNAMFRLGERFALRLPRRQVAAKLVENEQRWLPSLSGHLPLPVPAPLRIGVADAAFPWPWSATPWLEGQTADLAPPDSDQGEVLAQFFGALHQPAPADAPHNAYRGVPLAQRASTFEDRLAKLMTHCSLMTPQVIALWREALQAPQDTAPTWIHGDPHPRNVLVVGGKLAGVIDWGDIAQGDRATDLAAIWMLLPDVRARLRAIAAMPSVSAATWTRARGWAVFYAAVLLHAGLKDDPRMAAIATRTLEHLQIGP